MVCRGARCSSPKYLRDSTSWVLRSSWSSTCHNYFHNYINLGSCCEPSSERSLYLTVIYLLFWLTELQFFDFFSFFIMRRLLLVDSYGDSSSLFSEESGASSSGMISLSELEIMSMLFLQFRRIRKYSSPSLVPLSSLTDRTSPSRMTTLICMLSKKQIRKSKMKELIALSLLPSSAPFFSS